jgi:hypothetical protein
MVGSSGEEILPTRRNYSKTFGVVRKVGDKQTGDRLTAFRNAVEDRVGYLEVYASDVRDTNHRRALQFLAVPSERR